MARRSSGGGTWAAQDNVEIWVVVLVLVLVAACVAVIVYRIMRKRDWEKAPKDAEAEVLEDAAASGGVTEIWPSAVSFSCAYTDTDADNVTEPTVCSGELYFSPITSSSDNREMRCSTISGRGTARMGPFTVTSGKVSPRGVCYWTEARNGTNALITGAFRKDYNGTLTFEGKWVAKYSKGKFSMFEGSPIAARAQPTSVALPVGVTEPTAANVVVGEISS